VSTATDTWARRAGLALGLLLAVGAVLSWRIESGSAALGAQARFTAIAPGELVVAPSGPFLTLGPSSVSAHGSMRLRNIAGAPLAVELRVRPSSGELDRLLRVRIAGRELRLRALRRWTRVTVLRSRERRSVPVRAWLPDRARSRAAGAFVDVAVELRVEGPHG
jgi:hypothetical protein